MTIIGTLLGGLAPRALNPLDDRYYSTGRVWQSVAGVNVSAETALAFTRVFPSVIAGRTGRHNYTEWDQVLIGEGAAHPAMNPYAMPANRDCRRSYARDMCQRSLDILNRTVMVPTHPLHGAQEIADIIEGGI